MAGKRSLQFDKQRRVVQKLQELVEELDAEYCEELCRTTCEDDNTQNNNIQNKNNSKYSMRKQGNVNPCRNMLPVPRHLSATTIKKKPKTVNHPRVTIDGREVCNREGGENLEAVAEESKMHFQPQYSSVELRGGIHYNGCFCVKRDGLQDDCPRWDCAGRPECDDDPWPTCLPQQTEEYIGRSQPSYYASNETSTAFGGNTIPTDSAGKFYCCCNFNNS